MKLSEQLTKFLESSKEFKERMKSLNLTYSELDDDRMIDLRIEIRKILKIYKTYESKVEYVELRKKKNKVKMGKKITYGLPSGDEGFKNQWSCCNCGKIHFSRSQAQLCNCNH